MTLYSQREPSFNFDQASPSDGYMTSFKNNRWSLYYDVGEGEVAEAHALPNGFVNKNLLFMVAKFTRACVACNIGCFPLCQRFRSEFKWKVHFVFFLTGIFGITSGGGSHISVRIFRPKFAVAFLTNRFFALILEFGRRIWIDKSHFYWLAQFNRKMSFHFPQVFPLISDQSAWHNGKHH